MPKKVYNQYSNYEKYCLESKINKKLSNHLIEIVKNTSNIDSCSDYHISSEKNDFVSVVTRNGILIPIAIMSQKGKWRKPTYKDSISGIVYLHHDNEGKYNVTPISVENKIKVEVDGNDGLGFHTNMKNKLKVDFPPF
jgi:hypothetical protein